MSNLFTNLFISAVALSGSIASADTALNLATLGTSTQVIPFDDGVCLQNQGLTGADSAECQSACEMRGLRNTCTDDISWDELVDSVSNIWWAKWSVDLALQVAKKAKVGDITLTQHLSRHGQQFPSGIWDKTTAALNPVICATMILESASQINKINSGKTCSRGRSMSPPNAVEASCQLVYAVSSCIDTLAPYAPTAYAAYVSSGANLAVTGAMTSCSAGLVGAQYLRKVTAEASCMNTIANSAGIAFDRAADGSLVPQNCCVCDQEVFEDSWIPGADTIVSSGRWTAPVSSYAYDTTCEGRDGASFKSVIADPQGRWTETVYANCRRAKPIKGQCSLAR